MALFFGWGEGGVQEKNDNAIGPVVFIALEMLVVSCMLSLLNIFHFFNV